LSTDSVENPNLSEKFMGEQSGTAGFTEPGPAPLPRGSMDKKQRETTAQSIRTIPSYWAAMSKKLFEYQAIRISYMEGLLARMGELKPKPTLEQKINRFIEYTMAEARLRSAKKLAGSDWPEDE
jgi:hypothetical protein